MKRKRGLWAAALCTSAMLLLFPLQAQAKKERPDAPPAATGVAANAVSVNGIVRDRSRSAVANAKVTLYDGETVVGAAKTDAAGAFHVDVSAAPTRVEVSAKGFSKNRLAVGDPGRVIVVLSPAGSTSRKGGASADDLPALPYFDLGYSLAMRPFTTIRAGNYVRIADRGLGGNAVGRGGKDFHDYPARYATYAEPLDAALAFRSNGNADSGLYQVGSDGPERAGGAFILGTLKTSSLEFSSGALDLTTGDSRGNGTTRSRADFNFRTGLARGRVWASGYYYASTLDNAGIGDHGSGIKLNYQQQSGPYHITYETVLKQRVALSAKSFLHFTSPRSTYINSFKLQREGRVTLDIGLISTRTNASQILQMPIVINADAALAAEQDDSDNTDTGDQTLARRRTPLAASPPTPKPSGAPGPPIVIDGIVPPVPYGVFAEHRVFADARWAGPTTDINMGISAARLHVSGATFFSDLFGGPDNVTAGVIAPSLRIAQKFNRRFTLVAQQSTGLESVGLPGRYFIFDVIPPFGVTRSYLSNADLRYALDGRLSLEATQYKESRTGTGYASTLVGTGFSADVRLSPLFRVRAWTLVLRDRIDLRRATFKPVTTPGRDVVYVTYTPSNRIRADAIYRRETDPLEKGRYLDWDTLYRLSGRATLTASLEQHRRARIFGLGVRVTKR